MSNPEYADYPSKLEEDVMNQVMNLDEQKEIGRIIVFKILQKASSPKKVKVQSTTGRGPEYKYYTGQALKEELDEAKKDVYDKLVKNIYPDSEMIFTIKSPTNINGNSVSCKIIINLIVFTPNIKGKNIKINVDYNEEHDFTYNNILPSINTQSDMSIYKVGETMKGIGGVITYVSRYSLMSLMNISNVKDDVETFEETEDKNSEMKYNSFVKSIESKSNEAKVSLFSNKFSAAAIANK